MAKMFVFGFEWGMFGAAFATALCSGIGCAINIGFAYAKKMNIRFSLIKPEMDFVKRIISNGFSILVLEASSGIVTFVFIHYTARLYGNVGSAIYTIIMNWSLIFTNLTMGVAQAMQPLVSRSYGQGNIEEMTIYRKYSLLIVCDCE